MELFQHAVKQNYTFKTDKGNVTVIDLYTMPLTGRGGFSLDDVAKSINKQLKQSEEESFVSAPTSANTELQRKLDIVKAVIADKLADKERSENAVATKAYNEKIKAKIAEKQDAALDDLSTEELQKLLK